MVISERAAKITLHNNGSRTVLMIGRLCQVSVALVNVA